MRDINEFVFETPWGRIITKETAQGDELSKIVERYNKMNEKCDRDKKELDPYWEEQRKNGGEYIPHSELEAIQDFYEMYELYKKGKLDDFYKEYKLYQTCAYLTDGYNRGKEFKAKGIDLEEIKRNLISDESFKMFDYDVKDDNYANSQRQRDKILNCIRFPRSSESNPICDRSIHRHLLIKLPDEIKCVYCGFTTKEFKLSEEQIEFLAKAAEYQNILLTDATENDLPFIKLVRESQEEEMNGLLAKEEAEEAKEDEINDYKGSFGVSKISSYISDRVEDFAADMKYAIELAHRMDREDYYDKKYKIRYNPAHLTEEETKNYMRQVESELDKTTTEFDIASLTVKKYEILILSGKSISKLFDEIEDPIDKRLFVKAYTNLQRESYREECEFFNTERDKAEKIGWARTCTTANPELNKILLKAKEEEKTNK